MILTHSSQLTNLIRLLFKDVSLSGKRKGLCNELSGLFFNYIKAIKISRDAKVYIDSENAYADKDHIKRVGADSKKACELRLELVCKNYRGLMRNK